MWRSGGPGGAGGPGGRGDVGVRMMHEGGDSDYTGGSICLTDTLPGVGDQKQIK